MISVRCKVERSPAQKKVREGSVWGLKDSTPRRQIRLTFKPPPFAGVTAESKNMEITPLHLKILLHVHAYADPWPMLHVDIHQGYLNEWIKEGMVLMDKDGVYRTTKKGAIWVVAIQHLPFPVMRWEIPRDKDCA